MCIRCKILNLDFLSDPITFDRCLDTLPEYGYWKLRREVMQRLRFTEDKVRSLGAGLLLLSVLREYGAQDAEIEISLYGKPFLRGSRFQFNLSHSGKYAVCSYGYGDSGIDIEKVQSVGQDLANRFFHKKESVLVSEGGDQMFIRLWTLKECFIKADGRGLRLGLNTFRICPGVSNQDFLPTADTIPAYCEKTCVENDDRFHFAEFVLDEYRIAVCSTHKIERNLEIHTFHYSNNV